jgi:NhaP-type Na+/H+ and K+/H+ antiporter
MIPLFVGLTAFNLICLITSAVLGYASMSRSNLGGSHFLTGALSALACCAVHCVVFTYFIATAKWVQHAIAIKQLDARMLEPTRSFKAQAFPVAIAAMGIVFITAVFGAAAQNYGISISWHHFLAIISIATNVLAAAVELAAIHRNGKLIDDVLAAQPPVRDLS